MRKIALLLLAAFLFLSGCGTETVENGGDAAEAEADNAGAFGLGLPFPQLHIDTQRRPITSRTDWVAAFVSLDNTIADYQFENVRAEIRGRGNSSWGLEKRPYRLRFEQARTMLCSDHAARNWTLIANHSDKSLLRNYSAYFLAGLLDGMALAPYARFVDVYLNGLYQGVYMLSIHVEARAGRVELQSRPDVGDTEYLIQYDDRQPENPDAMRNLDYVTLGGRHYEIRYPRDGARTRAHALYVRQYLADVENMIFDHDEAVFERICIASFVDFYLVQELFKNQDVGFSSVFMTIEGQNEQRRLKMGPVWDFDIAAGNAYYQGTRPHVGEGGYSPQGVWAAAYNVWFRALMEMPAFREAVAARWQEIRSTQVLQMLEHIDHIATVYQEQFERNFERWPIMGRYVWPNPRNIVAIDTFRGQVEFLMYFIEQRRIWMDGFLGLAGG